MFLCGLSQGECGVRRGPQPESGSGAMWRGGCGSAGSAVGERLGRRVVSKWVKCKVITPVSDCSDERGETG